MFNTDVCMVVFNQNNQCQIVLEEPMSESNYLLNTDSSLRTQKD